MRYITGIQALNLPCSLETSGDWHLTTTHWEELKMLDTETSPFGTYGIEKRNRVPFHPGEHFCANHIRACLDLIEQGNFSSAQGMRDDYICNESYNKEIFEKVMLLKNRPNWDEIKNFMGREYKCKWLDFLEASEKDHC